MNALATKRKPPRAKVKGLTRAARLKDLNAFLGICFGLLDEDLREVANLTRLHPSTIYRLRGGDATLGCRFGTIDAIGRAAGLAMTWTETGITVRLID